MARPIQDLQGGMQMRQTESPPDFDPAVPLTRNTAPCSQDAPGDSRSSKGAMKEGDVACSMGKGSSNNNNNNKKQ